MRFARTLSTTAFSLTLAAGAVLFAGPALAGDAASGEKLFKQCVACHTVEEGGAHKVGPNLFGIVGKTAGQSDGYKYSNAMADSGLTWDDETLDGYLANPRKFLPRNKMAFNGLRKDDQRADVIAYLKTLQ